MKTNLYNKSIDCLTGKQLVQLANFSEKVQPYLPFEEVSFLQLIRFTFRFVIYGNDACLRNDLAKFNAKYYSRGFKINTRSLTENQQMEILRSFARPRMKEFTKKYEPIEKEVFIMMFRACKKYMITGRTKDSEDTLIESLRVIVNILN